MLSGSKHTDNVRIATITDPLSHVATNTYDNYGRLATKADFLNNIITYQYDNFGREINASSSIGDIVTTTYGWEEQMLSNPAKRFYSVQVAGNDNSLRNKKYDNLGRVVRSATRGFNGTIYVITSYNSKGQIESVSEPYYGGDTPLLNSYQYDNYGRKTSLTRPSGRNSSWSYTLGTGTITETITGTPANKTFTKTNSSEGTLLSSTDAGGTINYSYYPDGKIKNITAPGGYVTQMQYDIAGNQTQISDPSAGIINYTYTGFSEISSQQNARNQSTTYTYNSNGTISQKVTPEGTTSYTYNSQKQLTSISSPGNVSRSLSYDSKGRISSITETIPGTTNLVTSYIYAKCGRDSLITYPSGIVERRNYNALGYLNSISTINSGSTSRWTINTMNAYQQVTSGLLGSSLGATFGFDSNGLPTSVVYGSIHSFKYRINPVTGNLISRRNRRVSELRDSITYDNLDRIDYIYKGMTSPTRVFDMNYDANKGSISYKDDIGSLNYNNSIKPYSLSSVNQITGGPIPSTLDTINYTSFESISTITEGDYSASFTYNAENERAKMEVRQSGNVILTRWYSSSGYIKETSGGVTKEYTFIGGDAYSAPCVSVRQQGGSNRFYYLIRDHLGSIIQVSDSTAGSLYEYNYDAWGRLRNPTNWSYYSSGTEPSLFIAGRGFTGHEHLPWFNLINMNGRLYDPLTGQFLSPDSNVQLPDFTQNFNRYSYCLNNPLKYKDQNGEWVITALTMLANMWVSTSAANNWQFNPVKWDWKSVQTWSSLVQSGISGYKMGSSLEYKVDKIIHKSYYDNRSKEIIDDFNSRFELHGSNTLSDGYLASLDGYLPNEQEYVGNKVYYELGAYTYYKKYPMYLPAEDVGFGGSLLVKGGANIYIRGAKYYANVSASAYTTACNKGDVSYLGSVDVISGNKIVSTYPLIPFSGSSISERGWSNVGQNVFALPNFSIDDLYLRFNVGYNYSEGYGSISPFPGQGHFLMRIGRIINALSY